MTAGALPAYAQEPQSETEPTVWSKLRTNVELYGFLPFDLLGTTQIADMSFAFEADLGDVVETLEAGGALRLEAWGKPWNTDIGLIADAFYLQVGQDGAAGAGEIPFDVELKRFTFDIMAGYIPIRGRSAWLELNAGARAEWRDASIQLGEMSRKSSEDSMRFVAAMHVPVRLTERWRARMRSGIAVPDGVTWMFLGMAEYNLAPVWLGLGYRYDSIETEGRRLDIDVRTHSVYLQVATYFGDQ